MNYAKALKEARERKGLSQDEAARRAKTSQTYISKIEAGTHIPSIKMVKRLSQAYGVPGICVAIWAIGVSDVPKRNRPIYRDLMPALEGLVNELVPPIQRRAK